MDIDSNHENKTKHPYLRANFLSRITFFFVYPIIKNYYGKNLSKDDLYATVPHFNSQMLGNKLEQIWKKNLNKGKKSLLRILFSCFGKEYVIYCILFVLFRLMRTIFQPILVGKILLYFGSNKDQSAFKYAILASIGVIILNLCTNMLFQIFFFVIHKIALQIAVGVSSLIYRKALRLKTDSQWLNVNEKGGNIVTLITKDAILFDNTINYIPDLFNFLAAFLITIWLMYQKVGIIGFIISATIFIMTVIQLFFSLQIYNRRIKVALQTAARLEIIREVLSAIRIIKMYAWEKFFIKRINDARKNEMKGIFILYIIKFLTFIIGTICSSCNIYILIIIHVSIYQNISADTLFYVMILLDNLKFYLINLVPIGLTAIGELFSALNRIEQFLLLEEVISVNQNKTEIPKVELKNVTIKVPSHSFSVSFKIEKEGLVFVTGAVSVGKTILLKSILGEYSSSEGSITVSGKLSYASQEPWLFPSTIKQNIIFGEKFNQMRYEEVLDICRLQYDIERFFNKDETIVTDRGVNLSKGQQARISLARALYRKADIYLIDDCLNCLDGEVGIEVSRKMIDFLKNKIVLMITQNLINLDNTEKKVLHITTKEALLLNNYCISQEIPVELDNLIRTQTSNQLNSFRIEENEENYIDDENDNLLINLDRKNIYHEDIDAGSISLIILKQYVKYCGGVIVFLISMSLFIAFQISDILSYKFISLWLNQEEQLLKYETLNMSAPLGSDKEYLNLLGQRNIYFMVYNIVFILTILFGFLKTINFFYIASKASIRIHKIILEAVINARLTFFDNNLLGNIINRFSKDVYNLDENVPSYFFLIISMLLDLIFLLILVASMGWFFTALSIVTLLFIILILKYFFSPVTSSVKRLESAVHSSMVGYLNSSLEGLETIRVHGNENRLIAEFDHHQDKFSSAFFLILVLARCASVSIDLLGYIFLIITYLYIFHQDNIEVGDVGLILSTIIRLIVQIPPLGRFAVEFFSYMTSVERAINYTKIQTENHNKMELQDWPQNGDIEFLNVNLKYPSNHLRTLNGINIYIKAKEKVAIIGRTGSGKSSLISSLFNLYNFNGRILIDEVDIKYLSLNYRSKLGIIPQEPIIFSGSLRENLDPYEEFTDDQLWKTIRKVKFDAINLNDDIKSLKLSTGQKQLICLVRILLHEKKIVILDEATSNMDLETERFICEILKENLKDCTVLTIAHKLETIKDANRILILHNGQINSFENPLTLFH